MNVVRRSFYLTAKPDSVFAVLHEPAEAPGAGTPRTGVIFVPGFGWEDVCAYRSLRAWADACALAGFPALRIDLPGTGDSGGSPRDPGRVKSWTAAASAAAGWLSVEDGCERVVAIGVGLGGMVAYLASAEGAAIDDLVLWSVPSRGRMLLRELRAFGQLAASEVEADPGGSAVDDGSLEVSGFVLSAQTQADLEALDLATLALPAANERRVLLIGRESLPPDRRLREHLVRSGAAVTVTDGPEYDAMTTNPQWSPTPSTVIERTTEWISHAPPPPRRRPRRTTGKPAAANELLVVVAGKTMRETPFSLERDGVQINGILAELVSRSKAPAKLGAVWLNSGSVRRSGPNRMWTETARRWAASGLPTLRFDAPRIGDSDGDERYYFDTRNFYEPAAADDVLAVLDALQARGVANEFLLGGLCAGAYWAVEAALADERVRSLALVNLAAFGWSDELIAARDSRRAGELLRSGNLVHIARRATADGRLPRMARAKLRDVLRAIRGDGAHGGPHAYSAEVVDKLGRRGIRTLMVHSRGDVLAQELAQTGLLASMGKSASFHVREIPSVDHTFRAVWAQRLFRDTLDRELAWLLESEPAAAPGPLHNNRSSAPIAAARAKRTAAKPRSSFAQGSSSRS